jgi:hypothetical protein
MAKRFGKLSMRIKFLIAAPCDLSPLFSASVKPNIQLKIFVLANSENCVTRTLIG